MPEYINLDFIISDELNFDEEVMRPIRESISEQGLHHPLLVVESNGIALDAPQHYKLIAGKKRLLALKQLGTREAPVKIYPSSLTHDQQFEITLHENLRRHNLPWYEQVEMALQLHGLKLKLNGVEAKGHGGARRKEERAVWTQADTARELGISTGQLSEDLNLARAVAANPSLSRVKDRETALKLIRVQARRQENEAFALIPSDFEMNQVFLGDSLEILKQIPSLTFDAAITDPPWSQYARDTTLTAEPMDLLAIFREVYRALKNDSFLYLICSSPDFEYYRRELPGIGYYVQDYAIIWHKSHTITHGRRNWQYSRDYEPILLAVKGSPALTSGTENSSILSYVNLHYTKMIHPHEKPIGLLEKLIGDCTFVGNSVLDPFAGSGVTLDAARKLDRNWVGIEKDKKFYENIVRRLA